MDPNTGRIYPDLNAALLAGVENPVEIRGRLEDIERISKAVKESGSAKRRRKAGERANVWNNKENN